VLRQGELRRCEHGLWVDQRQHRARLRYGRLIYKTQNHTLGALPPEWHFHQVANVNLTLQGFRQVVVKDISHVGQVDSDFNISRHL